MRKIEQEMIQALRDGRNWQSGNTMVANTSEGLSVYLHGNLLGYIPSTEGRRLDKFMPMSLTYRRWPTATTTSRLRALGVNAAIRQGSATIDGLEV